jgi:hypothetical protein
MQTAGEDAVPIHGMKVNVSLALILLLPRLACAGVVFDETTRLSRDPEGDPRVNHDYVQGNQFRSDSGDGKTIVLLNNEAMFILNTAQHTYQSLTKVAIERAAAKLAAMTPEKIASLPAEDRATVQIALRRLRRPNREYRITDRPESVENRACRIWEGMLGGTKVVELCVAGSESVKGGVEIVEELKRAGHFFSGGLDTQGAQFGQADWWKNLETFDGLPILIRSFVNGAVVSETTLTTVGIEDFAPGFFDVPVGYEPEVPKHRIHLPDP